MTGKIFFITLSSTNNNRWTI